VQTVALPVRLDIDIDMEHRTRMGMVRTVALRKVSRRKGSSGSYRSPSGSNPSGEASDGGSL
jgi:hypothetical protein